MSHNKVVKVLDMLLDIRSSMLTDLPYLLSIDTLIMFSQCTLLIYETTIDSIRF